MKNNIVSMLPERIEFDPTQIGVHSPLLSVTIKNICGNTISLEWIGIPTEDARDFTFRLPSSPLILQTNETALLTFSFSPREIGVRTYTLKVHIKATKINHALDLVLVGIGIPAPRHSYFQTIDAIGGPVGEDLLQLSKGSNAGKWGNHFFLIISNAAYLDRLREHGVNSGLHYGLPSGTHDDKVATYATPRSGQVFVPATISFLEETPALLSAMDVQPALFRSLSRFHAIISDRTFQDQVDRVIDHATLDRPHSTNTCFHCPSAELVSRYGNEIPQAGEIFEYRYKGSKTFRVIVSTRAVIAKYRKQWGIPCALVAQAISAAETDVSTPYRLVTDSKPTLGKLSIAPYRLVFMKIIEGTLIRTGQGLDPRTELIELREKVRLVLGRE